MTDKAQSVLCGIFLNLNLVVWLCEDALSDYCFVVKCGLFSWLTTTVYIIFLIISTMRFVTLIQSLYSIEYVLWWNNPAICVGKNNCTLEAVAYKLLICIKMVYLCPIEIHWTIRLENIVVSLVSIIRTHRQQLLFPHMSTSRPPQQIVQYDW